jgi:hypothetical protein
MKFLRRMSLTLATLAALSSHALAQPPDYTYQDHLNQIEEFEHPWAEQGFILYEDDSLIFFSLCDLDRQEEPYCNIYHGENYEETGEVYGFSLYDFDMTLITFRTTTEMGLNEGRSIDFYLMYYSCEEPIILDGYLVPREWLQCGYPFEI